jgi:catechol 2,3-dioxygenase
MNPESARVGGELVMPLSALYVTVGEINVICTELDRSLRFYRDVLGFEVVEMEGAACHLACGAARLLLLPFAREPRTISAYCSSPEFSIDLMVEDVAVAHDHLRSQGVIFASDWQAGKESFFIRDPDGLVFEVIQSRAENGTV